MQTGEITRVSEASETWDLSYGGAVRSGLTVFSVCNGSQHPLGISARYARIVADGG